MRTAPSWCSPHFAWACWSRRPSPAPRRLSKKRSCLACRTSKRRRRPSKTRPRAASWAAMRSSNASMLRRPRSRQREATRWTRACPRSCKASASIRVSSTHAALRSPAAGRCELAWLDCCSQSQNCSSWTSRPTTWTHPPADGWATTLAATRALYWSCPTTRSLWAAPPTRSLRSRGGALSSTSRPLMTSTSSNARSGRRGCARPLRRRSASASGCRISSIGVHLHAHP